MSAPLISMLEAAQDYARKGIPVFPCRPRDKRPIHNGGFHNATTDEQQIIRWWGPSGECPNANIGMPTGEASGFVVLDIDTKNGGKESHTRLQKKYDLPLASAISRTGGGGWHLMYKRPQGGVLCTTTLGGYAGIDVRGDGGYVLVPPSIHPNGTAYLWEHEPGALDSTEFPATFIDLMNGSGSSDPSAPGANQQAGGSDRIPKGQRNSTLTSLAGTMRRRGMKQGEILAALLEVNKGRCVPPLPEDEVAQIAKSISRYKPHIQTADYRRSDSGNGMLFNALYSDTVRYDHSLKRWIMWAQHWWEPDADETARFYALELASMRIQMAAHITDPQEKTREFVWGVKSEQRYGVDGTLSMAKCLKPIADKGDGWDADNWTMGVLNGVLNLKTGQLRDGRLEDRVTKHSPVVYDPDAECPVWLAFLDRIMGGNANLIGFLRRAVGMSLTGDTSEDVFFILHGEGSNGKSTLLTTILEMLGDYGRTAPTDLLLKKRNAEHPTAIAELRGRRFVACIEADEGRTLAAALIKSLTGGDKVAARFLYQNYMNFDPTHKLFIAVNHKPRVSDGTHSMWRRLKLIPFNVTIPDEEQDKQLTAKLRAEWPGILRWAVEGCLEWRKDGLGEPEEVKKATAAYKAEEDVLGAFIEECCVVGVDYKATRKALFETYTRHCQSNGEGPLGNKQFNKNLRRRGFEEGVVRGSRFWKGLGLREGE